MAKHNHPGQKEPRSYGRTHHEDMDVDLNSASLWSALDRSGRNPCFATLGIYRVNQLRGAAVLGLLALCLTACGQKLEDKNTTNRVSTGKGVIYDRGGLTNPSAGNASNQPEWPVPSARATNSP